MLRALSSVSVVLLLAGCASIPPQRPVTHKAPSVKQAAPQVIPGAIPPATFKQRWFDKFKHHPKWFH